MLKLDQYEFIRTAHRVYDQSISKIAKTTGHSRNTVKKALRGEPWGYKEREHQPFPALGDYLEIIDGWLEADKDKPRKQRHTARRIFNRLKEEYGFKGCEATVGRYIRIAKAKIGLDTPGAFIPCDPDVGREAEVDWGTAVAIIAGEEQRLKFFCMRSKYSGKHFVRFYPCERQQAFFDAHIRAFAFFGGIFPVLIYDNLTTAVRKVLHGKARIEQEEFTKFKAYCSFEARFCNPGAGHEKGGVEGLVGFARRNYMVPVPEAQSLEELNEKIFRQCAAWGGHKAAGRQATADELHEAEKTHLLPLPDEAFSNIKIQNSRADKYATVMADKNRYSVPSAYAGFKIKVLLHVDKIELFGSGKKLATHERVFGNNKWRLNPDHYLDLIKRRPQAFESARPIRQWRAAWPEELNALLESFKKSQGQTKGVKDFVSVLMYYRDYRADEIEAAAALAVENNISASQGVLHILLCSNERGNKIEPLPNWSRLPAPDLSVYGQLGGTP